MASGGVRNRNGAIIDPNSGRSDRRGLRFFELDPDGYKGEVPPFPLPPAGTRKKDAGANESSVEDDEIAAEERNERELELWRWAWRTPQAIAWALEPWRWHGVAMWVRTAAICESADAMAADKNSLHRFADQVGLTPAGLSENGWTIPVGRPAAVDSSGRPSAPRRKTSRDRLTANIKVVEGGDK